METPYSGEFGDFFAHGQTSVPDQSHAHFLPLSASEQSLDFSNTHLSMPDDLVSSSDPNLSFPAISDALLDEAITTGFDSSAMTAADYSQFDVIPTELGDFGTHQFNNFISGYHKPKIACQYCASRQLECKIFLQEGVSARACLSCNALFRPCSFVEDPPNYAGRIATLHPVSEDTAEDVGRTTGVKSFFAAGATLYDIIDDTVENPPNRFDSPFFQKPDKIPRFNRSVLQILKRWIEDHAHHPYPTEEEKDKLKDQTGLSRTQVSNWLANARRRGKAKPRHGTVSNPATASHTASQEGTQPIDIARDSSKVADQSQKTPFERWKDSPPENEAPVPILARMAAATNFTDPNESGDSSKTHSQADQRSRTSAPSMFRAPSSASLDTTSTSLRSAGSGSAFSRGSRGSHSFARKDRRRRRSGSGLPRAPSTTSRRLSSQTSGTCGQRHFQCTFCTESFNTKYDWTRHEKSLHLNLEKWLCAPSGPFTTEGSCAYCQDPKPTREHLDAHEHFSCAEKDPMSRTFLRKDHLRQHLRLVHRVPMLGHMETWKSVPFVVKSRCGFCNARFQSWDERATHIAKHYKEGMTMSQWEGDWGLDPEVSKCLGAATLPKDRIMPPVAPDGHAGPEAGAHHIPEALDLDLGDLLNDVGALDFNEELNGMDWGRNDIGEGQGIFDFRGQDHL